ncbi:uncharacterized protein LOC124924530 [Impatiens glandulifera]|uniref:uncharacterized protein LOC124924530 n=1 Tax=Impatiens glandulifera TaxID=253017 RepID=UPI001FB1714B|nr:uncharacterized protein LOC124924530 [Impatiens glandulifera]
MRSCVEWNWAVTYKHLWMLQTKQDSLWVKWVHSKFLKHELSIWTCRITDDMTWSLKKILKLKNNLDLIFHIRLGDGLGTLFWNDPWFENRPLIIEEEFQGLRIRKDCTAATVCDIDVGLWASIIRRVPEGRLVLYYFSSIRLSDRSDVHSWVVEEDGKLKSRMVWNAIRERGQIVDWAALVWSSKVIPRHCFILWLTFRGTLSTRDRILAYIDILDANCVLCSGFAESIDHLLGGYFFAKYIWNLFTLAMGIVSLSGSWEDIKVDAQVLSKGSKFHANVFKCGFAAIVYHLWAERNARVFGRVHRNVDHVWSNIVFNYGALIRTWRRVPKGEREWVLCRE